MRTLSATWRFTWGQMEGERCEPRLTAGSQSRVRTSLSAWLILAEIVRIQNTPDRGIPSSKTGPGKAVVRSK